MSWGEKAEEGIEAGKAEREQLSAFLPRSYTGRKGYNRGPPSLPFFNSPALPQNFWLIFDVITIESYPADCAYIDSLIHS